jgi:hypothetical protein
MWQYFSLLSLIHKSLLNQEQKVIRCGTMQYYAEQMQLDPLLEKRAQEIANSKLKE